MRIPRTSHACGVHEEKYVIVEGGSGGSQTEILNLETLTWSDGSDQYFGNNPWNHRIVSKGKSTYLIETKKIWKLVTDESVSENGWEWVSVANLEVQEGYRDVFFMKTRDCQNWNGDTNNDF